MEPQEHLEDPDLQESKVNLEQLERQACQGTRVNRGQLVTQDLPEHLAAQVPRVT